MFGFRQSNLAFNSCCFFVHTLLLLGPLTKMFFFVQYRSHICFVLFRSVICLLLLAVIWIGEFIGSTIWLSVSNSRNVFVCWFSCCTVYESNSKFVKSEYSQVQYHFCPTAFNVKTGLCTASVRCSNCRDGIAINTRMIVGAIVQMVYIICPSKMNSVVCSFLMYWCVFWGFTVRYVLFCRVEDDSTEFSHLFARALFWRLN